MDMQQLIEQHNTLRDECDALDITKMKLENDVTNLQTRQTELQLELRNVQDTINQQRVTEEQETNANKRLQEKMNLDSTMSKQLPNRWPLTTLCFCQNDKCMQNLA